MYTTPYEMPEMVIIIKEAEEECAKAKLIWSGRHEPNQKLFNKIVKKINNGTLIEIHANSSKLWKAIIKNGEIKKFWETL